MDKTQGRGGAGWRGSRRNIQFLGSGQAGEKFGEKMAKMCSDVCHCSGCHDDAAGPQNKWLLVCNAVAAHTKFQCTELTTSLCFWIVEVQTDRALPRLGQKMP